MNITRLNVHRIQTCPMPIFIENFSWMIVNLGLAFLAVILGFLYLYFRQPVLKVLLFILWILFFPNTIYLITDIQYLPQQWIKVDSSIQPLLLIQYAVLTIVGVLTYFAGFKPIESLFKNAKVKKQTQKLILIGINLVIAFAVILGKVERTNSWYVFTQPERVIKDIEKMLTSPSLIALTILFAIMINLIYLPFRKRF